MDSVKVNYECDVYIIKFSKDRLLENHLRDDYRELLVTRINSIFFQKKTFKLY